MTEKNSMFKTPVVMTIAGSDSGGGAGIAADIKTFAAFGVHGTCAITSVTAQNTTGVLETFDLAPEAVASQIEAVCTDMDVRWAKTGMLASSEIIKEVAKQVKKHNLSLVLDPVMAAEAGGDLLKKEALSVLIKELLPLCKVTTPNASEAGALAGVTVKTHEDAKLAARKIADLGVESVIVTGGHIDATDLLYEPVSGTFTRIPGTFVKGGTHGSGCTYSASMAACLARGDSTETAARKAKAFVEQAILRSVPVGKGVGPVNPLANTLEEKERYLALQDVKEAVSILTYSPDFAKLIPEVGCNIGMAIPCTRTYNDIAAVEGGIIRFREKAIPVGCVNFGASQHVARVILAALRENPEMRAAMNVKFSEEILEACREINPGISSFDRAEDPGDASTMEWGTSEAIRKYGGMPEVIYDKGAVGKEPIIRLLGKSASEVARLAVELARRVK
ncbi:MAG: bifunctional hydroxymethylpyrimidine kinase/phosphomethylpyrimidine kinase [Methanosarcina mazei]|uniref:Phosphomethylpyrimidine kinase n=1 Tax=Methanosarcina mazei TaxID=2209 RepID=A0A0F8ISD1_METMZ|nr:MULTISPECIES: bifunctional hydroxymethylpyrimidine kinase/phosphomethylpyrimidine kinase [Methanosarcina]KKG33834.1 phosphomethylpyrimidine kinase [Methanosarcina mazei]KKG37245.1 phosphomethylpyrimidine kinase [Methanosarcina mazei]KKG66373.1 phosphomethylpyrimidine kinase [Methanosarcina mazei]KKG77186.1 phosphomethylpyrimidine kinase [Methanosarcina mazei]KKH33346.1 phosphomethylpyrimidine kinase [Methanosarcina mazei]